MRAKRRVTKISDGYNTVEVRYIRDTIVADIQARESTWKSNASMKSRKSMSVAGFM